jgi:hypothetical protein
MSKQLTYYGSKQSVAPYRFLLDEYPNAQAAYSMWKLSPSATFSSRIIRTGFPNNDLFGFAPNNLIDLAAIDAFFDPSAILFQQQFIDQSGNGMTLDPPAVGSRPLFRNAGVGNFVTLNGIVAPQYDGTDDRLLSGSNFVFRNTGYGLVAMVLNRISNVASEAVGFSCGTTTNTLAGVQFRNALAGNQGLSASGRRLAANSLQVVGTSAYSANQIIVIAFFDWANARLRIWENNVLTGDLNPFQTAGVTANSGGAFALGGFALSAQAFLNGHIQECTIWQGANAQAHGADIAGIFSNINSRFNTY